MKSSIQWRKLPGALWWHLKNGPEYQFLLASLALMSAFCGALLLFVHVAKTQHIDIQATSITPITSTGAGASGLVFTGTRYDVACTVSGGTATLYPAGHDGSAWTVWTAYPCALDSSVVGKVTCAFPANGLSGWTWNVFKSGSATVSSCTAQQVNAPIASRPVGSSSSGSTVTVPAPWSPVTRSAALTELTGSGSVSVGMRFQAMQAMSLTGVRFRRTAVTAGTIKASLWDAGGTRVATVDVAVNGVGTYSGTFASAVTATPAADYVVSVWDKAGAGGWFSEALDTAGKYPAVPFATPPLVVLHRALYKTGDAFPDTASPDGADAMFPVEPTYILN